MTQEEKQLLLKDLCARLPYGVKFQGEDSNVYTLDTANYFVLQVENVVFKPYFRPMSSMTEEEKKEYNKTKTKIAVQWDDYGTPIGYEYAYTIKTFDWLLSHHFDFRGLISVGLALEAKEGMYKTE